MPRFALNRIGQIALAVADVDRAEAFYRDVLGLRHLYRYVRRNEHAKARYEAAGPQVRLPAGMSSGPPSAGLCSAPQPSTSPPGR